MFQVGKLKNSVKEPGTQTDGNLSGDESKGSSNEEGQNNAGASDPLVPEL